MAIGASLLAADQTWQVIERYRWPARLFWLLILVMLGASVLNTALRMSPRCADGAVCCSAG